MSLIGPFPPRRRCGTRSRHSTAARIGVGTRKLPAVSPGSRSRRAPSQQARQAAWRQPRTARADSSCRPRARRGGPQHHRELAPHRHDSPGKAVPGCVPKQPPRRAAEQSFVLRLQLIFRNVTGEIALTAHNDNKGAIARLAQACSTGWPDRALCKPRGHQRAPHAKRLRMFGVVPWQCMARSERRR